MRRSLASAIVGAALWAASIIVGSLSIRILAVGFLLLAVIPWCWLRIGGRRVEIRRKLSNTVVPVGTPIDVTLDIRTTGSRPAPYVLLEETVPRSMGSAVRLCIEGVPPGAGRRAIYSVTPTRRGRMKLGPSVARIHDPFLMASTTSRATHTDAVIVTPLVEPLVGMPESGRSSGYGVAARRSRGQSEEFAAIRPYARGDDLRRIHWPSVARHGEMMLRQDEARQGSGTTIYIDTRASALGRSGELGFERAVSAAASLGTHLHRGGVLHLATAELAPVPISGHDLLVALASIEHTDGLTAGIEQLRNRDDPTLVAVLAPPEDPMALVRAGSHAAVRIACLIMPPPGTTVGARAAERADTARHTLQVAGWTVIELDANASLGERWNHARHTRAISA